MFEGRAWVFPQDDINTDQIHLSMYSHLPIAEQARHCLETLDPSFASSVERGDILVTGKNFGCGSARPAHLDLLELGIAAVVTESVDRKFFGNALSGGLPVITCPGILERVRPRDTLRLDLDDSWIQIGPRGETVRFIDLPVFARAMLRAGGEREYLQTLLVTDPGSEFRERQS